ncbi:hypothetical protein ILUMI_19436 [Ignelater luminosus]|uniref:Uncharacterized protein n=1 Tax=Ignelater luminosus TaxID=2038154 RepID=A0A8K0G385_IGNLU|nr:hypothetical protein ILUMI_19436 [Ignelater luminosus]
MIRGVKHRTKETIKICNETRKEAKQRCGQKKREHLEKRLKVIEEQYKNKEIRNFYQGVKKARKTTNTWAVYCKSNEGALIGDTTDKLKRWGQYFEELLNAAEENEQLMAPHRILQDNVQEDVKDSTQQEIMEATK